MKAKEHLIFIYGTLRRGGRAHHFMDTAVFQGESTAPGRLVHVDEYPGLLLCDDKEVKGELYLVSDALLSELDRYEGCFESPPHYTRQQTTVQLDNGEKKSAHVYVFQLLEPYYEEIPSGDWIEWWGS